MEDVIADTKLRVEEIRSSMLVLHEAISNEYNDITNNDINNCIDILIGKTSEIINILIDFEQKNYN